MKTTRNDNPPFFYTVFCALMLFIFPSLVSANPVDRERDRDPRAVTGVLRIVKLRPHPMAEVVIPEFHAIYLEDGSITLNGQGVVDVGTPSQGYRFEVDLVRGTYMTHHLSVGESDGATFNDSAEGRVSATEPYTVGTYRAELKVETADFIGIVLTQTSSSVEWDVDSTGRVFWRAGYDVCWANPETPAFTTWYRERCEYGDAWYSNNTICNNMEGWYINWDYGYDSQSTTAHDYVVLCGRNDGAINYNWSHSDAGEDAGNISGQVYYRYY